MTSVSVLNASAGILGFKGTQAASGETLLITADDMSALSYSPPSDEMSASTLTTLGFPMSITLANTIIGELWTSATPKNSFVDNVWPTNFVSFIRAMQKGTQQVQIVFTGMFSFFYQAPPLCWGTPPRCLVKHTRTAR